MSELLKEPRLEVRELEPLQEETRYGLERDEHHGEQDHSNTGAQNHSPRSRSRLAGSRLLHVHEAGPGHRSPKRTAPIVARV